MTDLPPCHAILDDAIRAYVETRSADNGIRRICTGWVLAICAADPDDPDVSSYMTPFAEGMPYHSRYGLLYSAVDDMAEAARQPTDGGEA